MLNQCVLAVNLTIRSGSLGNMAILVIVKLHSHVFQRFLTMMTMGRTWNAFFAMPIILSLAHHSWSIHDPRSGRWSRDHCNFHYRFRLMLKRVRILLWNMDECMHGFVKLQFRGSRLYTIKVLYIYNVKKTVFKFLSLFYTVVTVICELYRYFRVITDHT